MDALLGDPVLARRDIERRVARGAPDPGLPTASSYLQADLVVAGKHSGSRIGDAVMGSLSRFPAYYTACDVLEVCHTATNRHRLLSAHCMGGRNVPATCANDSHHSTPYRRANLRLPTLDPLVGIGESKYPSSCTHRRRGPLSDLASTRHPRRGRLHEVALISRSRVRLAGGLPRASPSPGALMPESQLGKLLPSMSQ